MALTLSPNSTIDVEANSTNPTVQALLDQIRDASKKNQQELEQNITRLEAAWNAPATVQADGVSPTILNDRANLEAMWTAPATKEVDGVSPALFSASKGKIDVEITDASKLSPRAQSEINAFYAEINGTDKSIDAIKAIPAQDKVVDAQSAPELQNALAGLDLSWTSSSKWQDLVVAQKADHQKSGGISM